MSITEESKKQYFSLVNPKYISWEFYKQYINIEPNFGELGLVVYLRTYSRFIEELNRREKWCETVLRVVEYSISLDTREHLAHKTKEAEELFDAIFSLRMFPAGRTLWIGGTKQTEIDGSANWNCTYCNIDTISSFTEIFYWLMIGAGTGFSVEQKHISKLPKFYPNKKLVHQEYNFNNSYYEHTTIQCYLDKLTNGVSTLFKHTICLTDSDYSNPLNQSLEDFDRFVIKIGDSKEGWCNALRLLLTLCTYDKELTIEFNYDNVRPKGELIKIFGGRSSGYKNLQQVLEDTYNILVRCNGVIDSLAALDIVNIIGRGVVSGGVRRTAEIALGDSTDVDFVEAKYNLWSDENKKPYQDIRVMSNNSLMFYEKPSYKELEAVINRIKNNGEPGFYIMGNARQYDELIEGTNPCLTGDMLLLTKQGYLPLQDLEGKEVELINYLGEVSKGKVWLTGEKQVYQIRLSNSQIIKCTEDHKFMLNSGEEELAINLKNRQLMPYLKYQDDNHLFDILGFIQGDGNLSRLQSETHLGIEINLGNKDDDIKDLIKFWTNDYSGESSRTLYLQDSRIISKLKELKFSTNTLPTRTFPDTYTSWKFIEKQRFLRGCYSANGSVIKSGRITYKSTCKEFIEQLQYTLLEDFGISSYITTNKAKEVEFSNGIYLCKESYDLNISQFIEKVKFFNTINFIQDYKVIKLRNSLINTAPYVTSIKKLGVEYVYDFSEPLTNWGVVDGFITHNCGETGLRNKQTCNLTTLNPYYHYKLRADGSYMFDHKLWHRTVKLATRVGSRITTVSQWHPEWDKVQKSQRLLGVSMTGVMDAVERFRWSTEGLDNFLWQTADLVRQEADNYHEELGIERSARVTLFKPEGTLSQLPTVSSGIHRSYAETYYRRIRFSSQDPLALALYDLNIPVVPENSQGDKLFDEKCNTWVFTFPVKTDAEIRAIDESAINQLERYKLAMTTYVRDGHNCSVTITVASNEWEEVTKWIYDNWDYCIGLTLLPRFDPVEGGKAMYPNMPYEPCSVNDYQQLKVKLPQLKEEELIKLLSTYESSFEEQELDSDCNGKGVCPVR